MYIYIYIRYTHTHTCIPKSSFFLVTRFHRFHGLTGGQRGSLGQLAGDTENIGRVRLALDPGRVGRTYTYIQGYICIYIYIYI